MTYAVMLTDGDGYPCGTEKEPCFLGYMRNPVFKTIMLKHRPVLDARRFTIPADAVAWIVTERLDPETHAVVGILPAAMREAEAAARAEWIDRGGRVQIGEASCR